MNAAPHSDRATVTRVIEWAGPICSVTDALLDTPPGFQTRDVQYHKTDPVP